MIPSKSRQSLKSEDSEKEKLSIAQQKCILCEKHLSGVSKFQIRDKIYDLDKIGQSICALCERDYCKNFPQFGSTDICKKLKQKGISYEKQIAKVSASVPKVALPEKQTLAEPTTRKSPYLDVRCQTCKKYVMKRKNLTPLTNEEQLDEQVECSKCKEACEEIQSDHPTDIKFCQMVHDILTSGML